MTTVEVTSLTRGMREETRADGRQPFTAILATRDLNILHQALAISVLFTGEWNYIIFFSRVFLSCFPEIK